MANQAPKLHVEGIDDQFVIGNLMATIGLTKKDIEIEQHGGYEKLRPLIIPLIKGNAEGAIGFVIDTDKNIKDRWKAVSHLLCSSDIELQGVPSTPPTKGFIGSSLSLKNKVGVWLMPNNTSSGAVEDFLKLLIPSHDKLFPYAQKCTAEAQNIQKTFPEKSLAKAELHTWLAWQSEPGVPYGTAIQSKFFTTEAPIVQDFLIWLKSSTHYEKSFLRQSNFA